MALTTALRTKGYAALAPKGALEPFQFDRREPGPHDVQIAIQFCGICHSDIHTAREEWDGTTFPLVPGHEIAGVVERIGTAVTKFKVGDRVGVGCFVDSDRTCEYCKAGLEQFCAKCTFTYNSVEQDGITPTYGGYSEKIVVDEKYVLGIPDNISLDLAAPLLCAGITLYSPLRHWNAGPGKKVAILGLGGLGHMGVKIAHAMGAEVTVLSQSLRKESDGKRMGADHFHATSDPNTFEKLAGTFDLIINTVSMALEWDRYLELLRPDGTMIVVGLPEHNVSLGAGALIRGRRSLSGSMIGGIAETQEMLDFCSQHKAFPEIERIPMSDVNKAYDRVVASDVRYRFVIDMSTL